MYTVQGEKLTTESLGRQRAVELLLVVVELCLGCEDDLLLRALVARVLEHVREVDRFEVIPEVRQKRFLICYVYKNWARAVSSPSVILNGGMHTN